MRVVGGVCGEVGEWYGIWHSHSPARTQNTSLAGWGSPAPWLGQQDRFFFTWLFGSGVA